MSHDTPENEISLISDNEGKQYGKYFISHFVRKILSVCILNSSSYVMLDPVDSGLKQHRIII